ncbi:acyl carrier protein [Kitasatospora sp. NBC_00240]|uniref:acyl carrier protein n=1 Tax=Kitasatospora sp. NBC_00240 TaxID=2903567 RepID=UPI00225825DA|nr:acyl carrier protein [Kitasatospora sp. NBC_00240]MCX5208102.1 acyl carrier protein [Kitasatospora sp. NBC_00240]
MTRQQLTDWLREYLADLLDITPEEVGTDIPLEYLGVDSATTLVLSADLSTETGRETRPGEILDHPTIERLAAHLSGSDEPARVG